MTLDNEQYLAKRDEYHLSVPKVPRRTIDVFGRDIKSGYYGLSAEKIQTIQSYVRLQETINSFGDLAFSSDFIGKLPDKMKEKLGENLRPGITLPDLELPTTDKLLLASMLAADKLTETLSEIKPEVWVTAEIKEELKEFGLTEQEGLQGIDYAHLGVNGKMYLVEVMERQEAQVHTILAARQRFPNGIPPLGISALLNGQTEWTKFDSLVDLETQFEAANQALNNPAFLLYSEILDKARRVKKKDGESEQDLKPVDHSDFKLPLNVEEEAKGKWWMPSDLMFPSLSSEDERKIADYLRPRYRDKTIYGIFEAQTPQEQEEVLSAFWRTDVPKRIDFGDEPWIVFDLYLKTNGVLKLHFHEDLWNEASEITEVIGQLEHPHDVAMIDQTVKWISEETAKMKSARLEWERSGFPQTATIEATFASALKIDTDPTLKKELKELPKWFLNALKQEAQYYDSVITYHPRQETKNMLDYLLFTPQTPKQNWLKSYFDQANTRLENDRRLIANPTELYKDLDLPSTATQEEVRRSYRRIAKETKPIFISSEDQFHPKEWEEMNDRFIKATRAYTAIIHRKLGKSRVTTLGRLSSYFSIES